MGVTIKRIGPDGSELDRTNWSYSNFAKFIAWIAQNADASSPLHRLHEQASLSVDDCGVILPQLQVVAQGESINAFAKERAAWLVRILGDVVKDGGKIVFD